jgi:hypothetical protein
MHQTTLALATSLALTVAGAAFAQTPAPPGSTENNLNDPGSVKSNQEKSLEATTGRPGTTAPATAGTVTAPGSRMSTDSAPPTATGSSVAPSR